jgi:hypothetical protein
MKSMQFAGVVLFMEGKYILLLASLASISTGSLACLVSISLFSLVIIALLTSISLLAGTSTSLLMIFAYLLLSFIHLYTLIMRKDTK